MNKNTVFVCFVILSAACFSGLLVAQQHGHFAEWLSPRVLCSGPCPTAQLRSPKPTERLFSDAAVSDTHKVLSWCGWLDGSSSSAGVFGLAEDFTLSAEAALQQPYLAQSLVIITGGTAELKRYAAYVRCSSSSRQGLLLASTVTHPVVALVNAFAKRPPLWQAQGGRTFPVGPLTSRSARCHQLWRIGPGGSAGAAPVPSTTGSHASGHCTDRFRCATLLLYMCTWHCMGAH